MEKHSTVAKPSERTSRDTVPLLSSRGRTTESKGRPSVKASFYYDSIFGEKVTTSMRVFLGKSITVVGILDGIRGNLSKNANRGTASGAVVTRVRGESPLSRKEQLSNILIILNLMCP